MGWNYNAHTILNKLTLEWVSHISNSLDCLLQYINASLNLGLKQKAVTEGSMHRKLEKMPQINSYVENYGRMRLFAIYVLYIIMENIHLTYMEVHHCGCNFWTKRYTDS